jgi:hypothetical protein
MGRKRASEVFPISGSGRLTKEKKWEKNQGGKNDEGKPVVLTKKDRRNGRGGGKRNIFILFK